MEAKIFLSEIYENNATFAGLFETLMSKGSHAISSSAEELLPRKKVRKNVGLEHYNRFSNDDGNIVVGNNVCANKYLVMYILDFVIEDPISIYSVQLSCCELRSWKHSKLQRLKLLWVFNSLEKTIERMIQRHGSIRGNRLGSLKLCRNNVDDKEAQVLGEILSLNLSLKNLDIRGNLIGDKGAKYLGRGLEGNTSLKRILLDQNEIGYLGASALGKSLETNSSLETFDLRCNQVGDLGAKALSESLKLNTTLTKIDLWDNLIGDQGAKALSACLIVNSSLKKIDLRHNKIGDEGANALAESLKTNSSLMFLLLSFNQIGPAGEHALLNALKMNSTISSTSLFDRKLVDDLLVTKTWGPSELKMGPRSKHRFTFVSSKR